ncbi:MAG: electron transfer flavoprotein subunit beta/FixA family protein [Elusimicrobia bacterium]|nr:electron transfer flavoprotein subunit beta/FixA family protein [Elusimicrobiota bacterium]MDD7579117.1 electron transfer flavoprotein subunit beta/FixA family protein [Elusimicrobiota bacterium]MDY6039787.1 electron transfer flavoprotein subunit beta/FixA family protein [Elusimicrobiaceae bacterium]
MHIVACVKQTPKSDNVKIDPATGCLIRSGAASAMNPFDEYALEEAVMLKEQLGGTVSVITMGPPQAEAVLRDSIARGADKVYQLGDMAFAGSDTWSTSYALSKGIEKINSLEPVDLVICGKQTNDSDTGHIGPQVSAWMKWPNAAFVKKVVAVNEKSITVERLTEDGSETLEIPFPCVISVVKDINSPRVRSVKGRMAAKRAEVTKWTADDVAADKTKLGMKNCPTRVVKSFVPKREVCAACVEGANAKERGAKLVDILKENKYI